MTSPYSLSDDFMEMEFSPTSKNRHSIFENSPLATSSYHQNLFENSPLNDESFIDMYDFNDYTDFLANSENNKTYLLDDDDLVDELLNLSTQNDYDQSVLLQSPCHCDTTNAAYYDSSTVGSPVAHHSQSTYSYSQSSSTSSISSVHASSPLHKIYPADNSSRMKSYSNVPPIRCIHQTHRYVSNASLEMLRQLYNNNSTQISNLIEMIHTKTDELYCDNKPFSKSKKQRELIELNILLPNGYFVTMEAYDNMTLKEIKHELWIRIKTIVSNKDSDSSETISKQKRTVDNTIESCEEHPKIISEFVDSKKSLKKSKLKKLFKLPRSSNSQSRKETIDDSIDTLECKNKNESQTISADDVANVDEGDGTIPSIGNHQNESRRPSVFSTLMNRLRLNNSLTDISSSNQSGGGNVNVDTTDDSNVENNYETYSTLIFLYEDKRDFAFQSITVNSKVEDYYDDDLRLADLNLFVPYLRLVELVENKTEKTLNDIISLVIEKPLNDLDTIRLDEFCSYRQCMYHCMVKAVKERESLSIDKRILYEFPPELDEINTLTLSVQKLKELDSYIVDFKLNQSTLSLASFDNETETSVAMRTDTTNMSAYLNQAASRLTKAKKVKCADDQSPIYTEVITMPPVNKFKQTTKSPQAGQAIYINVDWVTQANDDEDDVGDAVGGEVGDDDDDDDDTQSDSNELQQVSSVQQEDENDNKEIDDGIIDLAIIDDYDVDDDDDVIDEEEDNCGKSKDIENDYKYFDDDDIFNFRKPYKSTCSVSVWASNELCNAINASTSSTNCILNKDDCETLKSNTEIDYSEIVFDNNFGENSSTKCNDSIVAASADVEVDSEKSKNMDKNSLIDLNEKLKRKNFSLKRLFSSKRENSTEPIVTNQIDPILVSPDLKEGSGYVPGSPDTMASTELNSNICSSSENNSIFSSMSESDTNYDQMRQFEFVVDVNKCSKHLIESTIHKIIQLQEFIQESTQKPSNSKLNEYSKLKTISKFLSDKFSSNYSRLLFSSFSSGKTGNYSRLSSVSNLDAASLKTNIDEFIFKICGYEEYIVGDYPLIAFEYIRNCVSKGKTLQLMLVLKKTVIESIPKFTLIVPSFIRRHSQTPNSTNGKTAESRQIKELSTINEIYNSNQINITNTKFGKDNYKNNEELSNEDILDEKREQREKLYAIIDDDPNDNQETSIELKLSDSYNSPCVPLTNSIVNNPTNTNTTVGANTAATTADCNYSTISHVITDTSDANDGSSNYLKMSPTNPFNAGSKEFETFSEEVQSLDSWIEYGIENKKLISLWKIDTKFRVRILLATYVNIKDVEKIYVQAGLYHGNEPLCQHQSTKHVNTNNPRWDEMLEFPEIYIQDLPLSARLSIALCATGQRKKPQEDFTISWINLQLFNYRRCLLAGRISLSLWPIPKDFEGVMFSSGCSGCNPNRLLSPRLQVEFDSFPCPVVFPPRKFILDYARIVNKYEIEIRQNLNQNLHNGEQFMNKLEYKTFFNKCSVGRFVRHTPKLWVLKQLRKLISRRDLFTDLSEQEKDFFWRERYIIKKIVPDALPKVLESVRWSCREEVCQMYAMLDTWPVVSVDTAIILLGVRYVDAVVRSFAIRCLDVGLTNGLMIHYLLQFVQLLKNEPYLYNDLAKLLLRRSLLDRRFGNLFFWHLRSEISDSFHFQRWCVLLEMYCRGLSMKSLEIIHRQVRALDEIERISNETINETDRFDAIMKQFHSPNVLECISNFYNPLNISVSLGELKHKKCRVMDSAKRPLWLEWSNANANQLAKFNNMEMSAIIFKSGDDLRQDMLTLQVIRIIDLIWRRENLDLKLLPYNCLATGDQVGLIEVVSHAKTVMGIQRCGGRMAALQVDSSKLHKWIKDHNKDNYDNAVDNFTRSCAGYCVATFILGIGDRNPDNIMVNESGQIFHIDFGHFLGHFKKKFGINRERVPFVLTYDFLQIITKGAENPLKSREFEAFQCLCNDAYLALHDNSSLLISLFLMMLGIGIPELQTIDDVQYLRQTLQVDKSRKEALNYFESQLDEAHGGAWSTKLDWFFHSVKHA